MQLESPGLHPESLRRSVPIIVVFTQYDRLVMKKEYELRESEIPKTEDEIPRPREIEGP